MNHMHLQARADTSCPICFVWVAYQKDRAGRAVETMTEDERNHSFLVAGYWTSINRNGEVCAVHRGQLEQMDRQLHASRESLIKIPGSNT